MADPLVRAILDAELDGDVELVRAAEGVVTYARVLLDDEESLTRLGNLTGAAKGKLRARALELIGAEPDDGPDPEDDAP